MRDLLSEVSHSTERMQSYLYFSYIFNNNKKISISLTLINSTRRYKSSTLPADATLLMYGDDIVVSVFPGCLRGFPSPAAMLSRAAIITLQPLLRCCLGLALSPSVPCCDVVSGCHYHLPSPATLWSRAAIIALRPTSWSVCQRWSSRV